MSRMLVAGINDWKSTVLGSFWLPQHWSRPCGAPVLCCHHHWLRPCCQTGPSPPQPPPRLHQLCACTASSKQQGQPAWEVTLPKVRRLPIT